MASLDYFADRMRYWCDEGNLGYDQIQRWDIWEGGECDCSSLVIHALNEAGFDTGYANSTHDLSVNLTARGWVRLPVDISTARPGDILLSDQNHVAAVIYGWGWWATIAEAWLDEKGGIYYGQAGDQTGLETRTRGVYDFPWDCILRYEGDEMSVNEIRDAVLGYKNPNMYVRTTDENLDTWQHVFNASYQTTRTDNAGWKTPKGHDIFGRVNHVEEMCMAMQEKIEGLAVGKVEATIDYDKLAAALAPAVADEICARMQS